MQSIIQVRCRIISDYRRSLRNQVSHLLNLLENRPSTPTCLISGCHVRESRWRASRPTLPCGVARIPADYVGPNTGLNAVVNMADVRDSQKVWCTLAAGPVEARVGRTSPHPYPSEGVVSAGRQDGGPGSARRGASRDDDADTAPELPRRAPAGRSESALLDVNGWTRRVKTRHSRS